MTDKKRDDLIGEEIVVITSKGHLPFRMALPPEKCSEIEEALNLTKKQVCWINLVLSKEKTQQEFGRFVAGPAHTAFHCLRMIAGLLGELAKELEVAEPSACKMLGVSLSCEGRIDNHAIVRETLDKIQPTEARRRDPGDKRRDKKCSGNELSWFFERCLIDRKYDDHNPGLNVIVAFREAVDRILELEPTKPRGSPGKVYRNSIIGALAMEYADMFGEAPTTSPNGRFALLCELVLNGMGIDDEGLDKAIQRVLRKIKIRTA